MFAQESVMDIQRQAFQEWYIANHHDGDIHPNQQLLEWSEKGGFYFASSVEDLWEAWQAAKAQAVPEGFVVVPREPYAYLIKHKLWKKDSDPEIFLAVDFLGDDGVEKENLTVCIPLYKGGDEAQEQKG